MKRNGRTKSLESSEEKALRKERIEEKKIKRMGFILSFKKRIEVRKIKIIPKMFV